MTILAGSLSFTARSCSVPMPEAPAALVSALRSPPTKDRSSRSEACSRQAVDLHGTMASVASREAAESSGRDA